MKLLQILCNCVIAFLIIIVEIIWGIGERLEKIENKLAWWNCRKL